MRIRLATAWVAALMLGGAVPAGADVDEFVGKPIASVSIQSESRTVTDPRVLGLVETRVGEPLDISAVRASIAHLFSLGRFEDVRAVAGSRGSAVGLTYELMPLRPVRDITFTRDGSGDIDEGQLRRNLIDRFGASPSPGRSADMARFLEDELKLTGYLHARVAPRTDVDRMANRSTLVFAVAPGDRTRIGTIDVQGQPQIPIKEFLDQLDVSQGAAYRPDELGARISRYVEGRKSRGFYAARVLPTPRFEDGDRLVNLTLVVSQGPHVTVTFDGDPLPADRRAELVPIEGEGSTDEDLLEDSSNRIEEYLRGQGYREASAPHTRKEGDGELSITFTVKKGPQFRVGRIDIRGNASIPLETLQQRLRVRTGQPSSEASLDADLTIIEDTYRRAGFASVRVDSLSEPPSESAGIVDVLVPVQITVTEGVQTMVTSVRVDGSQTTPDAALRDRLGLQPQKPFFLAQMAADRDGIQLYYANLGYQSATVVSNPGISADGRTADVVFTVQEGPRIFVDHVLIVGNERTRTATIERELQFKPGDPLGLEAVNESQRRLAALGLFRRARITELGHGDENRRDVLVTLEEAPVTTLGYGGGLEAGQFVRREDADNGVASDKLEVAPRAFFEIGRRNLFGKNRSIDLFTRISLRPKNSPFFQNQPVPVDSGSGYGFSEYRVIGTFREPRVFTTSADAFLTATVEQQIRSSFDFERRSASAEVAQRLTPNVSASGGYQIQRARVFNQTSEQRNIDRIFPKVRLSSVSGSVIRDTRSDPLDPAAGRYLSANAQLAARRIGSEVGFAKSFFTAQAFQTLTPGGRIVVAASARLGLAAAFPTDDIAGGAGDLPPSERFFAGGDTTVRGFALDQVGIRHTPPQPEDTLDSASLPLGGNGLVILNLEMRVPVRKGLGVVGFIDAGNVFARTPEISLGDLRSAIGFGFRYKSPVGPIRVDIGFKLHRNEIAPGRRESLSALHISLGEAF